MDNIINYTDIKHERMLQFELKFVTRLKTQNTYRTEHCVEYHFVNFVCLIDN